MVNDPVGVARDESSVLLVEFHTGDNVLEIQSEMLYLMIILAEHHWLALLPPYRHIVKPNGVVQVLARQQQLVRSLEVLAERALHVAPQVVVLQVHVHSLLQVALVQVFLAVVRVHYSLLVNEHEAAVGHEAHVDELHLVQPVLLGDDVQVHHFDLLLHDLLEETALERCGLLLRRRLLLRLEVKGI